MRPTRPVPHAMSTAGRRAPAGEIDREPREFDAFGNPAGVIDCAEPGNPCRHIRHDAGGRELYLGAGDPHEFTNVHSDLPFAGIIANRATSVPA